HLSVTATTQGQSLGRGPNGRVPPPPGRGRRHTRGTCLRRPGPRACPSVMAAPDRSAESVEAREALRQKPHEKRARKADDVQVVALDPLDEGAAPPLDRIGARAALPLAAREVG